MRNTFLSTLCLIFLLALSFKGFPEEAFTIRSYAAVLMDAETGTLLFAKNKDEPVPPASLTKLMTIHIALNDVAAGAASLDEPVQLPKESWRVNQPPRSSLMFLAEGQRVTLRELLLGLAVSSGNDAAVAVAMRCAPSVEEFAARMNAEAAALGLSHTAFVEPSGISEYNMTTAYEYAVFCRFYIKTHPETLETLHSVAEFAYPKPENVPAASRTRPGTIVQKNRNSLLGVLGVDGLKTGYIDESGYNIALTAKQGATRLIAVILGAPAGEEVRDTDGRNLLEWGFSRYKTLYPVMEELPRVRVWRSKQTYAALTIGEPLPFTARSERGNELRFETEVLDTISAPCVKGDRGGELVLYDSIGELRRIPLLIAENVERGGFLTRLFDAIRLFFMGLRKKNG
ncbi:MAG: D-alanyl-D-alanine carboxypeptidase [Treponema sp.]|jgi:D-alanyl-D-alanine carboxypeptidase (penicillin-binding protein 5/6)|nr:D-alanyl-D-alanine carboxypeptidase [Treponema sp.]